MRSGEVIEPGMPVRGANADLGAVAEVIADEAGVVRGVVVSHGLFSANIFVPADRIGAVNEGVVETDLTREEAMNLTPPTPST